MGPMIPWVSFRNASKKSRENENTPQMWQKLREIFQLYISPSGTCVNLRRQFLYRSRITLVWRLYAIFIMFYSITLCRYFVTWNLTSHPSMVYKQVWNKGQTLLTLPCFSLYHHSHYAPPSHQANTSLIPIPGRRCILTSAEGQWPDNVHYSL